MRVLNVDLDFFLSDVVTWPPEGVRYADELGIQPWSGEDARRFLEDRCLLDTKHPLPGAAVVEHVEVFEAWKHLIARGTLSIPFDVVHVDAHADLGLGDAAYIYLMTELLGRPVDQRDTPTRGGLSGLGSGNYLAFAIACRWIRTLTYVYPPGGGSDALTYHLRNHDPTAGMIEMEYVGDIDSNKILSGRYEVIAHEPAVPLIEIRGADYQSAQPFDMAFAAKSPNYIPTSAEPLFDVIREYIKD